MYAKFQELFVLCLQVYFVIQRVVESITAIGISVENN